MTAAGPEFPASLTDDTAARLAAAGLATTYVLDVVTRALEEDLDGGVDVTSVATVPFDQESTADLVARADGVVAGLDLKPTADARIVNAAGKIVCPGFVDTFASFREPGFEEDRVPRHEVREEGGRLLLNPVPVSKRHAAPHERHPLERPVVREPGPIRVLGLSTTAMDTKFPRYSTSDALLEIALAHAGALGAETKLLKANELRVRNCEGYYSKSAHACTWPCSITQMDSKDQMAEVYEGLIFWADAVILASPIRWGSASSLYFKLIERMNCIQNQITIRDRVLIRDKAAAFIITGGQDNVQAVAGQMLMFFSELGFDFPQFPFIAHSRGWTAEDMENNVEMVRDSAELHDGARVLLDRCLDLAGRLQESAAPEFERAGRKASGLERRHRT